MFMGHRIITDGLKVDHKKVTAIAKMLPPAKLEDSRSFLGRKLCY